MAALFGMGLRSCLFQELRQSRALALHFYPVVGPKRCRLEKAPRHPEQVTEHLFGRKSQTRGTVYLDVLRRGACRLDRARCLLWLLRRIMNTLAEHSYGLYRFLKDEDGSMYSTVSFLMATLVIAVPIGAA